MKRLLSLSLFLMTVMLSFAHHFDVKNADGKTIYYNITSSTTVAVTYKGTSYREYSNEYTGDVTIPESVNYNGKTYNVTSIDLSFAECSELTSVVIPNSVTTINESAFYKCSGLTSVNIGNNVTYINYLAFYKCSSLTSITIPNSVTSIGSQAFEGCYSLNKVIVNNIAAFCNIKFGDEYSNPLSRAHHLYSDNNTEITDLVIPYGVTKIDSRFNNCNGLTSVTIPNSVTSIGNSAFSGCSGLTSITIPNSVMSIGDYAFSGCTGLTSVTIGNGVTEIGWDTFNGCSSLTSVTIGNGVTDIGGRAFYGCSGLISVTIPNSVTKIGSSAFEGCSGLLSITFGNGLTTIESRAFWKCRGLTSITIPNSVTTIGDLAFSGCSGLASVNIPNSVTNIGMYAFDATAWYSNQPNGLVYAGKVAYHYKGTMPGNTSIILDDGTLGIAGYAFIMCSNLTSITIPNSVTTIGKEAFMGCGLTSINIPNSLTSIGHGVFSDCRGLTSVVIPNSVTTIGYQAFYGCSGLVSITIPNSVTNIDREAFSRCSSLTSISIPNSVTGIGDEAFYGCSGLTSVTIPNSVTKIGDEAFRDCRNLKEIISYVNKPFYIYNNCWNGVNKSIPLYVPAGTKEKYQSTNYWNEFTNIIEFGGEHIEPATEPQEVDMAVVPDQMNLNGMVVGDTYYVLDADNGDGADSENGCVVIITTTNDEAVNGIAGKDVSDASVKAVFKGIIFMVPAGTGTISINAETLGTSSLKVKIGSQAAQAFQLAERETVEIPYNVAEPTYVYIYAGTGIHAARSVGAARAVAAENSVKVYSYKWEPTDPTGISSIDNSQSAADNEAGDWYTIDGRKLSGKPAQKGIYIVNGRKVAVK